MSNEERTHFLTSLLEEKLKSQDRRGTLISQKLSWVTGLFALGAIKLPLEIESQTLLYLVPIIALVFDLYILGEDYGIKRMGAFVKIFHPNYPGAQWERWLPPRRDRFSWYALPLSTLVITLGCALLLYFTHPNLWILGGWFALIAISNTLAYSNADKRLKALDNIIRSPKRLTHRSTRTLPPLAVPSTTPPDLSSPSSIPQSAPPVNSTR